MKGKKMFSLLRSLDAEEFGQLSQAVRSPLINTNSRVVSLYDYLAPLYPGFDGPELEDESLFEALFPGEGYTDYKLRRLLSAFTKACERFLVYLEAFGRPDNEHSLLTNAYGRRKLYPQFEKAIRHSIKELEKAPYRGLDYYSGYVELFYKYYFHPLTDKRSISQEQLQELVNRIDLRYALTMLRVGNELRSRERMFSESYQLDGVDALETVYSDGELAQSPVFRTYLSLLKIYKEEEKEDGFEELKEHFLAYRHLLRQDDQFLVFQQILNYTIRRINRGDSHFYREALELYKKGLETGLLLAEGHISEATFSNIVLVGCEEGEFIWVQEFMQGHRKYLDRPSREDVLAYCQGLWHYFQEQYDEAGEILMSHKFSDAFQLPSRMTQLRMTFEQFLRDSSYHELLLSQISNFRKYLARDKSLSKARADLHAKTLSLLKGLANAIWRGDELEPVLQRLEEEIRSDGPLLLRYWLQKQVHQLKKGAAL